jgi:hypothetical protein
MTLSFRASTRQSSWGPWAVPRRWLLQAARAPRTAWLRPTARGANYGPARRTATTRTRTRTVLILVDEYCTSQVHAQAGCWQRSLHEAGGFRWKACTHAGCPQIGVSFDRDAGAARALRYQRPPWLPAARRADALPRSPSTCLH